MNCFTVAERFSSISHHIRRAVLFPLITMHYLSLFPHRNSNLIHYKYIKVEHYG